MKPLYCAFLERFANDGPAERIGAFSSLNEFYGAVEFIEDIAGQSYQNGLYRTHTTASSREWKSRICAAFQIRRPSIVPFGYDWLGRQFALDKRHDGIVFLFDIDFVEVLEIPADLVSFHNVVLIDDADAAISLDFYRKWSPKKRGKLNRNECVGHSQPPFLGGKDEISNLKKTDMEVHWTMTGELLKQMGWKFQSV